MSMTKTTLAYTQQVSLVLLFKYISMVYTRLYTDQPFPNSKTIFTFVLFVLQLTDNFTSVITK